jgi:hypothetical protein
MRGTVAFFACCFWVVIGAPMMWFAVAFGGWSFLLPTEFDAVDWGLLGFFYLPLLILMFIGVRTSGKKWAIAHTSNVCFLPIADMQANVRLDPLRTSH